MDDEVENDCNDTIRIKFQPEEQLKRASKSNGMIASLEELKIAFVSYLNEKKPHLLKCEVETLFQSKGWDILWTPPYCPELQPIERFWAIAKNHVAYNYNRKRTMKEVVRDLREGWYGSAEKSENDPTYQKPVNCAGLWKKCVQNANSIFVPLCGGISGTVGYLTIDENYVQEEVDVPIDTLVALSLIHI